MFIDSLSRSIVTGETCLLGSIESRPLTEASVAGPLLLTLTVDSVCQGIGRIVQFSDSPSYILHGGYPRSSAS